MSIRWHDQCLHNQKIYIKQQRKLIEIQQEHLSQMESRTEFYEAQINSAKKKMKDGFDSDKFMKGIPDKIL